MKFNIEKYKTGGKVEEYKFDPTLPNISKDKKGGRLSKDYIKKAHEKPGGSNVGKKEFASGEKRTGPYVGPSGGAPKGSYPIPDVKHAKAALSLAHNAPNPAGIKAAVYKKFPALKHQKGGNITTADSTKYYSKQMASNMEGHFTSKDKEEPAKKVAQSKSNLLRQANKGKAGFDKNGFPIKSNQRGGTVGEGPKEGDTAAVYKKGSKVGKKQVGGAMGSGAATYGAAKKGAKLPEKKGKIDSSKWKK